MGQVVVMELTGDVARGSAGSCLGKLEWKAVTMLATNSEMGTEEVSRVVAVTIMCWSRLGWAQLAGVWIGVNGSLDGGEMSQAKHPRESHRRH